MIVVVFIVVVFMTETSIDLHLLAHSTGNEILIGSETAELNQVYNGNEMKLNREMKFEWFYANLAWSLGYEKRFGAKN